MFEIQDQYGHFGRGDADYECFKYPHRLLILQCSGYLSRKRYMYGGLHPATFFSPLIRK
jgi:hypothetical protein